MTDEEYLESLAYEMISRFPYGSSLTAHTSWLWTPTAEPIGPFSNAPSQSFLNTNLRPPTLDEIMQSIQELSAMMPTNPINSVVEMHAEYLPRIHKRMRVKQSPRNWRKGNGFRRFNYKSRLDPEWDNMMVQIGTELYCGPAAYSRIRGYVDNLPYYKKMVHPEQITALRNAFVIRSDDEE